MNNLQDLQENKPVIAEVITTSGASNIDPPDSLTIVISNNATTVNNSEFLNVTNQNLDDSTITLNLTVLKLEE